MKPHPTYDLGRRRRTSADDSAVHTLASMRVQLRGWQTVSGWPYSRYFAVPDFNNDVPEIISATAYLSHAHIEDHEFFSVARSDPRALKLWAEQEMITSANFSQALAAWIAS